MRSIVCIYMLLICSCMNVSTIENREMSLNSQIGKSYPYDLEVLEMYGCKILHTNEDKIELEKKEFDACSFAILYDGKTKIMKSWRYTSPREKCDRNMPITGA